SPEKPRSFLRFCNLLGKRSVTEFNYRYAGDSDAHVFAGIELSAPEERKQIIDSLRKAGIEAVDLTGDENAELHIRHMIGGRAHLQQREHVFRFEFPERAGALANFLKHLKPHWNISMFHYRFHGADYGRVLAGFQVPDSELKQLHEAFEKIGYTHWSADDSLAYQMFLADPKGNSRPKRKIV
ncbi:MAG: threonine ammonia-lyase, biosynthetic, partial [Betaproteobacteria bacterium]|nr:threonine ammonia-lyase, biosynthetic [Betaproteobacteria bacterium]